MRIDTLKHTDELIKSGIDPVQAQAHARALQSTLNDGRVVDELSLEIALQPLKTDMSVLKWMMATSIALSIGILVAILRPALEHLAK